MYTDVCSNICKTGLGTGYYSTIPFNKLKFNLIY